MASTFLARCSRYPVISASVWSSGGKKGLEAARKHVDSFHLDVMDGNFVPTILFGPQIAEKLRRSFPDKNIDVHLMVVNSHREIGQYAAMGVNNITVPAEQLADKNIAFWESMAFKIFPPQTGLSVALRPQEEIKEIEKYLPLLSGVVIMGTDYGVKGVDLHPGTFGKVQQLRLLIDRLGLPIFIEVDGGLRMNTVERLYAAGADVFALGSLFFDHPSFPGDLAGSSNWFYQLKNLPQDRGVYKLASTKPYQRAVCKDDFLCRVAWARFSSSRINTCASSGRDLVLELKNSAGNGSAMLITAALIRKYLELNSIRANEFYSVMVLNGGKATRAEPAAAGNKGALLLPNGLTQMENSLLGSADCSLSDIWERNGKGMGVIDFHAVDIMTIITNPDYKEEAYALLKKHGIVITGIKVNDYKSLAPEQCRKWGFAVCNSDGKVLAFIEHPENSTEIERKLKQRGLDGRTLNIFFSTFKFHFNLKYLMMLQEILSGKRGSRGRDLIDLPIDISDIFLQGAVAKSLKEWNMLYHEKGYDKKGFSKSDWEKLYRANRLMAKHFNGIGCVDAGENAWSEDFGEIGRLYNLFSFIREDSDRGRALEKLFFHSRRLSGTRIRHQGEAIIVDSKTGRAHLSPNAFLVGCDIASGHVGGIASNIRAGELNLGSGSWLVGSPSDHPVIIDKLDVPDNAFSVIRWHQGRLLQITLPLAHFFDSSFKKEVLEDESGRVVSMEDILIL